MKVVVARNQQQNFSITNFGFGETTGTTETHDTLAKSAALRHAEDAERARYIKEQEEIFEKENAAFSQDDDQEQSYPPQPEEQPWRPTLVPVEQNVRESKIEQLNSSHKKKRSE